MTDTPDTPPDLDDAAERAGPPPAHAEAARAERTNRLAIVALLTGLAGLVVFAVGFAVAALVQVGRRGEKGRGLAVGALAASVAWLAAGTVLATAILAGPQDDRTVSAASPRPGEMPASTTLIGGCISAIRPQGSRILVVRTSCQRPHIGEIGTRVTLLGGPYRGNERLTAEAEKKCEAQLTTSYEVARGEEFDLLVDLPDEAAWERGEHNATCVLRYPDGERVGVLRNERNDTKSISQLEVGDCVEIWVERGYSEHIVDCDEEHEVEVYAVLNPEGEDFPTMERVSEICGQHAYDLFGRRPPENTVLMHLRSGKMSWVRGEAEIICLAKAEDEPLTHSVLPG